MIKQQQIQKQTVIHKFYNKSYTYIYTLSLLWPYLFKMLKILIKILLCYKLVVYIKFIN